MYAQAIKYFEKSMNIWSERELLKEKMKIGENEEDLKRDNMFKECVYNLVVIHKKMGNVAIAAKLVTNFLKI